MAITPDEPWSYENRGTIYLDQGVADHAIAMFEKALALNPKMPLSLAGLGKAYIQKSKPEEAIPYLSVRSTCSLTTPACTTSSRKRISRPASAKREGRSWPRPRGCRPKFGRAKTRRSQAGYRSRRDLISEAKGWHPCAALPLLSHDGLANTH